MNTKSLRLGYEMLLNSRFEVKRLNADDVVAVTDFIVVYYNADEEDCY